MRSTLPRGLLEYAYRKAELDYLRSLPLEHFMEAIPQATQRKITLESLDLITARRPDFQVFSELLVQYPLPNSRKFGQVVPDNMIVIHPEPRTTGGSYNIGLEPVGPYCVMEYVSPSNPRKDYEDNKVQYENGLKVPYYLLFYPELQDLMLYRYNKTQHKFVQVKPNKKGRLPIPKLELEIAIFESWVRYWYQGQLLPLPGQLQSSLDEANSVLAKTKHQLDQTLASLDETEAKLDETEAKLDKTEAKLDEAEAKLDKTEAKLDETEAKLDQEALARQAAELEVARLRAELVKRQNGK